MEPEHGERPPIELLETNRPPGPLERLTTRLLNSRAARVAGLGVVALAVGAGLSAGLSDDDPTMAARAAPEDAPASSLRDPDDYEPPPWVTAREIGWAILGRPEVNRRSPVYVVVVRAVNRSLEDARTDELRAIGRFSGRPGFRFSAGCEGYRRDASGALHRTGTVVQPGDRVLLRCTDAMEYSGNRPSLDVRSIRIESIPCEDARRRTALL